MTCPLIANDITARTMLLVFVLGFFNTDGILAQDLKPVQIGSRHTIQSDVLGQEREYLVYLPDSYDGDRYLPKSYPVLFLMDGSAHFHYTSGMIGYMGMSGQVPEMIVVAVPHVNRTKELTPTNSNLSFQGKVTETFKDSGGADQFLTFLTSELAPAIDEQYRTHPFRILMGHSFGGLFAANALLNDGQSFQAYLLADPSLWWDNQIVVKRLTEANDMSSLSQQKAAIFISTAEPPHVPEDNDDLKQGVENHFGGIAAFAAGLESAPHINCLVQPCAGETHGSIPIQTLYQGLRHIFDGYQPATEMFLLEPEKLKEHYRTFSDKAGVEFLPDEQMLDVMGLGMLAQDDFRDNAIRLLEINAGNYPNSPNAHCSLANAYLSNMEKDKARAAFTKALELDPDNEIATTGLKTLDPSTDASASAASDDEPAVQPHPVSQKTEPVLGLLTDHFEVEIEQKPEVVWNLLRKLYVDGDRYRQRGLNVAPLKDDIAAHLGGLHATSGDQGPVVDLKVYFSAIDDESYFLANYLDGTLPQGKIPRGIYVTHDVSPHGSGARYQVVIQTFVEVELNPETEVSAEAVRKWMSERVAAHKQGLEATVMNEIVSALDSGNAVDSDD